MGGDPGGGPHGEMAAVYWFAMRPAGARCETHHAQTDPLSAMALQASATPPGSRTRRPFTKAGLVGAILVVLYSVAQPQLNDRFGWNLPALLDGDTASESSQDSAVRGAQGDDPDRGPSPTDRFEDAADRSDGPRGGTDSLAAEPGVEQSVDSGRAGLKYGLLREVGADRYLSPAGLLYTPGSAEGHRLKHLERHTKDQPGRPGKHGVFEGGMEATVRLLDDAYERIKAERSGITTEVDGDRTVHTVNMNKRIGYVGGREGNRRRKPMARRVRIVLEGQRVITAYPL